MVSNFLKGAAGGSFMKKKKKKVEEIPEEVAPTPTPTAIPAPKPPTMPPTAPAGYGRNEQTGELVRVPEITTGPTAEKYNLLSKRQQGMTTTELKQQQDTQAGTEILRDITGKRIEMPEAEEMPSIEEMKANFLKPANAPKYYPVIGKAPPKGYAAHMLSFGAVPTEGEETAADWTSNVLKKIWGAVGASRVSSLLNKQMETTKTPEIVIDAQNGIALQLGNLNAQIEGVKTGDVTFFEAKATLDKALIELNRFERNLQEGKIMAIDPYYQGKEGWQLDGLVIKHLENLGEARRKLIEADLQYRTAAFQQRGMAQ